MRWLAIALVALATVAGDQEVLRFQWSAVGDVAPPPDLLTLEDFSNMRTCCGGEPLWNNQSAGRDDLNVISGGILSMTSTGAGQFQNYFKCQDPFVWRFLRDCVDGGALSIPTGTGLWKDNVYNRMRFWIRTPAGADDPGSSGRHNLEWANFLHNYGANGGTTSDDNNGHYYHFLNAPPDGLWYQVIIDTWPDHQRGSSGGSEYGDLEYPDPAGQFSKTNIGKKYFDLHTAFYLDYPYNQGVGANATVQLRDKVTLFFEDNTTVPGQQVRSITSAFDPATNTVKLGWARRKDQSGHRYTVRYAHQPITTFTAAKLAGLFASSDSGAYNNVRFAFSDPALAGHQWLWVGIQPEGSSLFRQVPVPLTQ